MRLREWLGVGVAAWLVLGASTTSSAGQAADVSTAAPIECGAGVGKRKVCDADTSAGVVLIAQTGDGACELGRTWGFDSKGVWTANGCRGSFAFSDTRATVTCSATGPERVECAADTRPGVALLRGSPACVLGRTWGYDEDGVWVSNGCDASFLLSSRAMVACASSGERQSCAADTAAGVVLARSTDVNACVLGESWGYDRTGVWVDRGCRGEFVLGSQSPGDEQNRGLDAFFANFEPYGRLLAHVAVFEDEFEIQDNASWIGLEFSTRGPVKLFAATEWEVNLVRGGQSFNRTASTDTGFPDLDDRQADQVFGGRLGYVGVDFGYGGRIAVGKQLAVHTDVSMYTTEQFNVFGSEASGTFPAGTDGGGTGTGRADQVVTYRNTLLGILRVGGQLQFRTADNDEVIDGYGASAQLTLLPGFRVGAAYTKTRWNASQSALIPGLDDDGEWAIVGARADWKVIEAGLTVMRQRNGDLTRLPGPDPGTLQAYAVDADGLEAILRLNIPGFAPYGGVNYYRPKTDGSSFHPAFRTRYAVAGAEVGITGSIFTYAEARFLDDSVDALGNDTGFSVLTVGVHYGFQMKGFHRRY